MRVCDVCKNWTHEVVGYECVHCLKEEVVKLKKQIQGHCDRIAGQSKLLSKKAERIKCTQCDDDVPVITLCSICVMKEWSQIFEPRLTEDEFNAKYDLGKGGM